MRVLCSVTYNWHLLPLVACFFLRFELGNEFTDLSKLNDGIGFFELLWLVIHVENNRSRFLNSIFADRC